MRKVYVVIVAALVALAGAAAGQAFMRTGKGQVGPDAVRMHPRAIFRRAIENGNLVVAETVIRELGRVTLEESLALVVLVAAKDPRRHSRYAMRWLRWLLEEDEGLTLEEVAWRCRRSRRSPARRPSRRTRRSRPWPGERLAGSPQRRLAS